MSTPSQKLLDGSETASQPRPLKAPKQRTIHNCNFCSAGRLSNEDARALTTIHENLAQNIASALDVYLGTAFEVKLDGFDQLSIRDHLAEFPAHCYVVPGPGNATFLEIDSELVFPIVELLLGGTGDTLDPARELSEIEEEIMQDIVLLIWRQAGIVWRMPDWTPEARPRIKAAEMHQAFAMNEKAMVFRFNVQMVNTSGSFRLVLPIEFGSALLKQSGLNQPQRKSRLKSFPMPPLRERILDCDVEVIAELPALKVQVRDLIALQPGTVLKLHAPIRNPGMLTTGGHGLFEAAPVRMGSQRAAQLGQWIRNASAERR